MSAIFSRSSEYNASTTRLYDHRGSAAGGGSSVPIRDRLLGGVPVERSSELPGARTGCELELVFTIRRGEFTGGDDIVDKRYSVYLVKIN